MAEILEFQTRPRSERDADRIPEGGARILFFTGVRYERVETLSDVPTTPTGGGKRPGPGRNRRRRA